MGKTIAVTGINSYFAKTVLPLLEADPEISDIIGIDITPWKGGFPKVRFHQADIRSPELADLLSGTDTVYHMAFVVAEIRDKKKIFDINVNGSKNVIDACLKNRVRKIIYTSSATVYGAHRNNPLGFTEQNRTARNPDSYYNSTKIDVEQMMADAARSHPEIIFTIIRSALLFGPNADNMFTKLFCRKISALPWGSCAHNQYIHEDDLGTALYLAYDKDLPGIYNAGADDAIATCESFRRTGVRIIPVPAAVLKKLADIGFRLGIFPAGGGWVSLCRYSIFMNCDKFKAAAGWRPKWTSEETFNAYLEARGEKA